MVGRRNVASGGENPCAMAHPRTHEGGDKKTVGADGGSSILAALCWLWTLTRELYGARHQTATCAHLEENYTWKGRGWGWGDQTTTQRKELRK